jgi:hypothetical protein
MMHRVKPPPKRNRPPGWGGGAALKVDLDGSRIDRKDTPKPPEYQAPRLAAYRLSVDLVVEGCQYV